MSESGAVVLFKNVEGEASLPDAVYYHGAQRIDEKTVVVMCGSGNDRKVFHQTHIYEVTMSDGSVVTKRVKTVDRMDVMGARYSPATTAMARARGGRYAILYGGSCEKGQLSDMYLFSPNSQEWAAIEPTETLRPPPGIDFSLASIKNMVYLLPHGPGANGYVYGMLITDRTWVSIPLPWHDNQAWRLYTNGKSKLVFLGTDAAGSMEHFSDTVHEFDIHKADWSEHKVAGQVPRYRVAFASTVIDNRFVVMVGGFANKSAMADFDVYDMETRTWRNIATEMVDMLPVFGAAVVAMSDTDLVLFGGRNNVGRQDKIWQLHIEAGISSLFAPSEASSTELPAAQAPQSQSAIVAKPAEKPSAAKPAVESPYKAAAAEKPVPVKPIQPKPAEKPTKRVTAAVASLSGASDEELRALSAAEVDSALITLSEFSTRLLKMRRT